MLVKTEGKIVEKDKYFAETKRPAFSNGIGEAPEKSPQRSAQQVAKREAAVERGIHKRASRREKNLHLGL